MKQAAMGKAKVAEHSSRKQNGMNGIKSSAAIQRLSLKPMYICVDCSEKHSNGDRKVHTEKTSHIFCENQLVRLF